MNLLLSMSSSNIPRNLKSIKEIQYKDKKHLKKLQVERLKNLIIYAYEKVPYYRVLLKKYQIIKSNEVKLENLSKLPILTKDVIKKQGANLYSRDRFKRGFFFNSTGGSTGENISFIQDKYYRDWNIANKLFYLEMAGKYIGEKEVKLWGSERDLFKGTVGIKNKAINFLYNRRTLNCLKMSSEDMDKYVRTINNWRPKIIWAYANAIFELSNYIDRNSLKVYAPNSIISCATTLYPYMREKIERIFKTKVYNQYGGREVGDIACECEYCKMHIFEHTHFIEVVDRNDELIEEGIGNIIVTSLTNYSMPFLRYKVGDMGEISNDACNCNRAFNYFKKFIGRDIETFYKQDGEIVLGEFFALLLYKDFIKKFQIVQEKYDHIKVKLISDDKRKDLNSKLNAIKIAIKQVMGEDCEVEFQVVDELDSKLPSGKNIYVISKVRK